MNLEFKTSFTAICLLCILTCSCKKQTGDQGQGQVEVNFSITDLKSASLSNADTLLSSTLTTVVVSIEDLNSKVVKNSEKVDLYNMNGSYISKPLSLTNGNYKLTRFLVLDWKNNVVYAAPLQGSSKAGLVENPLPLTFSIKTNTVTKLNPEVVNAAESLPEDFGYATFTFDVAKTFDFKVGTFIYNDTIKNYMLASSTISVYADTVSVFSGTLTASSNGALVTVYDSLGITNKITLPERYNKFLVKISKPGYYAYSQSYTKEELKLHLRSVDKGPLVVILEKDPLFGLVAYYKFNGDVKDYSGNNNNGTYYGRGIYSTGYKSDTNGAIDLNGSTDYVAVNNSTLLNPKQISICAWYYAYSFNGCGANSLVTKRKNLGSSIQYQYHLNVLSDSYGGNPSDPHMRQFGFNITTDKGAYPITTTGTGNYSFKYFQYQLYEWNFIVGTFDGDSIKLYVNGDLRAWGSAKGNLVQSTTNVHIGNFEGLSESYYFTAGRVDEVRIYNRALTNSEILSLYKQ
ncbi:MAG TPA: LamG domain-containing protein [Bacteroidales bacterium]